MSKPERREPSTKSPLPADSPWIEPLARWLIRRAALGAPADLKDRLEEEWLADLSARSSALAALRLAIGCCWATKVIALEHAGARVALAAHAGHPKLSIGYFSGDSGPFSRRPTVLFTVIALHAAVFYALMVGLGITGKRIVEPPLQYVPTDRAPPKLPPMDMPRPEITHTKIDKIIPEIETIESGGDDTAIAPNGPPATAPPGPPVQTHVVSRALGGPGAGFPNTDDFYPSAAKRLEEQGLVAVQVCVDTHGRLTGAPKVLQSSNSARLDAGALELARAGSGHYRPSTEDNLPIDGCYPIRIRFQLRN